MGAEEESPVELLDTRTRGVNRLRPRMRSVGVVHVVAALIMAPLLMRGELRGCVGNDVVSIPAGLVLALIVGLAGVVMVMRTPRASAVAPAASAGASLSLLGGAGAGWIWLASQPCLGNALDREVVTLLLVTAGAAAALGTSLWLLYSRDELEPWYATRGVVLAAAASAILLVCGVGFAALMYDAGETPVAVTSVAVSVPWAIAVAATGWLRPSPAVAAAMPATVQGLWLLLG